MSTSHKRIIFSRNYNRFNIATSDRERFRHYSLTSGRQESLSLRRHGTSALVQLVFFAVTVIIDAAAQSQRRRTVKHIHPGVLSTHDMTEQASAGRQTARCASSVRQINLISISQLIRARYCMKLSGRLPPRYSSARAG